MISSKISIEVKAGERSYQMICSPDSPLGELYDALMSMRAYVLERMQEHEKDPNKGAIDDHVQPADPQA